MRKLHCLLRYMTVLSVALVALAFANSTQAQAANSAPARDAAITANTANFNGAIKETAPDTAALNAAPTAPKNEAAKTAKNAINVAKTANNAAAKIAANNNARRVPNNIAAATNYGAAKNFGHRLV